MPSLLPGFEYDIFISYRHKDNKGDRWVTEFVTALKSELEATFKEDISIYFDENPHDGLLDTHDVDQSLNEKVKCLVFIPIVSQTYCDPKSFAWQKEFLAFRDFVRSDAHGLDIKLQNGNVTKRILPVRIHELDAADKKLFEDEIGGVMRPIDFIFKAGGVNRPLREKDDNLIKNHQQPFYRDNINKVANAVKDIVAGITRKNYEPLAAQTKSVKPETHSLQQFAFEVQRRNVIRPMIVYMISALLIWKASSMLIKLSGANEDLLSVVSGILWVLFPVATIMAWMFERSPSGFVRYGTARASDNTFSLYQRKPLTGDLSILILMIATLSLYFLPTGNKRDESSAAAINTLRLSMNLEHEPSSVVISKDGLTVAYTTEQDNMPLFVRNLNEETSKPLASTEGAANPFFSLDGKSVGYFKEGSLYRTSIERSNPLKITDKVTSPGNSFAFWDSPDTIFVGADIGTKLYKVSVLSGQVVSVPIPGQSFSIPSRIPGTAYLLGSDENSNIVALSLKDGSSKIVMPHAGWQPRYVEPGYLVYALQGRLFAIPFDLESLSTTGSPIPILSKVETYGLTYTANYDIASNGTVIYSSATSTDLCNFVWVNQSGQVTDSLKLPADFYGAFSLSPDGKKLVYGLNGPNSNIWLFDLLTGQNQKLTEEGVNKYPIWSPDGLWVTYSSYVNGKWDIYRQNFNSTQQREKLTSTGSLKRPGTWSPYGKQLTFYEVTEGEGDNMYLLSLDDKKISAPWKNTTQFAERQPRFSPDGKYICYMSSTSGINGLYVEPFPATGQRWQIALGLDQIWSLSGNKIFFAGVAQSERSYSYVELSYNKGISASPPKEMFRGPFIDVFDKSFEVSRDDKSFLVLKQATANEHMKHYEIIVNWREELKRVLPRE